MALVIEYTVSWLRLKNNWAINQCGPQVDALPAMDAGPFYVAVDDAGVETGGEDSDYLKEIFTITIGIWRRPEHFSQRDRRGELKLPNDRYISGAYTLADLERLVLVHKTVAGVATKNGLHGNWLFRQALNTNYGLPDATLGAEFTGCLTYRGRSRMEGVAIDNKTVADPEPWLGYRLRFRGLSRTQKMRTTDDAIG